MAIDLLAFPELFNRYIWQALGIGFIFYIALILIFKFLPKSRSVKLNKRLEKLWWIGPLLTILLVLLLFVIPLINDLLHPGPAVCSEYSNIPIDPNYPDWDPLAQCYENLDNS